jgi:hypothetical protein
MTIHVDSVALISGYEEPNGSFGTDNSSFADITPWTPIPFTEATSVPGLDEQMETPGHTMQLIDAQPIKVHMPKRGRLGFDINLAGLGLATGARTQGGLGLLLKVAMGGEFLGNSTTVNDAGATTTTIILTSASNFRIGGVAVFTSSLTGKLEAREIKNISSNTVTLKYALTGAPANGSAVYGAATYYLGSNTQLSDANDGTTLQLLVRGLEPDDRWLFRGGQLASPPKFTIAPGGIPRMSFEWQFAQWFQADGASTGGDFVGPELTASATYSNYRVHVIKDSELRVHTVGTSSLTSTNVDATAFEFNPNIAYWPHLAPGGLNNVVRYVRKRAVPAIAGSFTVPYEDMTWFTAKSTDARKAFMLQIGSSPTVTTGGGILLSAPTIQITDVQRVSIDGITGQQVSWEGTVDGDTTGPDSSLEYSAFRIHLF